MSRQLLLLPLLLLLIPAGCGGSSGSGATTSLRITVWPQGKAGTSISYSLSCPQGTGTLPGARAACSKLQRIDVSAFAPVPGSTACTQIYGGPQVARVSGRLAGKSISADFSRTDGCQIARWSRLAFLFPTGL
ncbi:MAG TPA: SSI family serine proteinase inhibitor [Gaiellaceae bacterium]